MAQVKAVPQSRSEQAAAYKALDFNRATEADLIAKAAALRPLLRANAPLGDQQRSMTDDVFQAITDLGAWAMLTPRRWGGLGLSVTAMSRINREIAKGDPAVAWVVQIINGTTWIGTMASDAIQEELFGETTPRICSSFAIPAIAKPVEGGYVVSGAWPYNSGSRQAHWGQFAITIEQPDGAKSLGNFAYIPMSQVEIKDTWRTVGLQGTSSDTSVAENVFVPEHMVVHVSKPYGTRELKPRFSGEPSDYWPVFPLIRTAGLAMLIGATEAALELAFETAKTRGVPNTFYARQSDSGVIHRNLGEAAAKIRAAELLAADLCTQLDQAAIDQRELTPMERAQNKVQCSLAIMLLTESLDKIMYCAGSSAFMLSNDLQRFWKDVNIAARHAINLPDFGYEIYSRARMGLDTNIAPPGLI